MVKNRLQGVHPPLLHSDRLLNNAVFTARKLKVRSEYTIENCLLSSSDIIYVIDSIFIIPSLIHPLPFGF
jgi:hypothetical protein